MARRQVIRQAPRRPLARSNISSTLTAILVKCFPRARSGARPHPGCSNGRRSRRSLQVRIRAALDRRLSQPQPDHRPPDREKRHDPVRALSIFSHRPRPLPVAVHGQDDHGDADRRCRLGRQNQIDRRSVWPMFQALRMRNMARPRSATFFTCRQASPFRGSMTGRTTSRAARDLFIEPGKTPSPVSPSSTRALRHREPNGTTPASRPRFWGLCYIATREPVADYLHSRVWVAIGAEADVAWGRFHRPGDRFLLL